MTQTTTAIIATDVVVQIDKTGDVLTDISGSSNKLEMTYENTIAEGATFGSLWLIRKVTGKDAPLTLTIIYSTASDEAWDIAKDWFFGGDDSARSVQIDVPDSTAGNDRFSGEYILENASVSPEPRSSDLVMVTLSLKPSAAVARADIV